MKLKAIVQSKSEEEVKWLVIESDEDDTKGFFIYYFTDDNTAYDTWHKTIEDAYEAAFMQYGITKENWEDLSHV